MGHVPLRIGSNTCEEDWGSINRSLSIEMSSAKGNRVRKFTRNGEELPLNQYNQVVDIRRILFITSIRALERHRHRRTLFCSQPRSNSYLQYQTKASLFLAWILCVRYRSNPGRVRTIVECFFYIQEGTLLLV